MNQNKVLSLLGLAARGRNVASGESQTLNAVKNGKAMLVLVAEDASDNTRKLFADKCGFYRVPFYLYGSKASLGQAIGKDLRSSVAVINAGLAEGIRKLLEAEERANGGR